MSNSAKLFVPMNLEALVLRQDTKEFLDLSPRLDQFNQSILGNVFNPKNRGDQDKKELKKGIHLHWTLPKALKHTFLNEKGESNFPYAPNRWMIIRIQTDKGIKDMESRIWMIHSDQQNELDKNKPQPNWAEVKNGQLEFKSLGKTFDWNDYEVKPTQSIFEPILTAVGAVNPNFASIYHSCKNVFAFHDDLEGLDIQKDAIFTYVVSGWYSHSSIDPLSPDFIEKATHEEQEQKKLIQDWFKENWPLKDKAEEDNDKEYPTSCMLHSSIHSIKWDSDVKSGVPKDDVNIYAGNTAVECLSAQILKSREETKAGIEELMNALQYQLLEDIGNEPDFTTLRSEIHTRGFSPKSRGIYWEINRIEEKVNAKDEGEFSDNKERKSNFPQNANTLADLKELNKNQLRVNTIDQEVYRLQQEYYFLWYKEFYKLLAEIKDSALNFTFEAAKAEIQKQILTAQMYKDEAKVIISEKLTSLKNNMNVAGKEPEFQLQQKLEDRFWEPNDIVLLLCGDGVGNTNKPIFKTRNANIRCRIESELLKSMNLNVPYNSETIPTEISHSNFKIPNVDELYDAFIPFRAIKNLVYETLLLDQSLSVYIAIVAYNDDQKDKTSEAIISFAEEIRRIQSLEKSERVEDFNPESKLPEAFSITTWQQAWAPLFMVWEVDYTPDNPTIKDFYLLDSDNWEDDKKGKMNIDNPSKSKLEQSFSINGISPFSNSVFANLQNNFPEIVSKYGNLNLVAQSLSGLNKLLVMQRPDIQLPPLIYTPDNREVYKTEYVIDEEEIKIIGEDGYRLGCNPGNINDESNNLFNPLRAGFIQIKKLSIVDVFGQEKKVIIDSSSTDTVLCANTLNKDAGKLENKILFPPRIIQPTRIQFNWLNAQDSILYQDTGEIESPVLAWLVPNYLDNSILVYDGKGKEVVVLQIASNIKEDKGLQLLQVPFPGSDEISKLSQNPQLEEILKNLNQGSVVRGIMDLALKVNGKIRGNTALQINTSSLLSGQPLALVRCSIELELLGLPYYNQQWNKSILQDNGEIDTIQFPLMLGDFKMQKDGLLGYFLNTDTKSFYTAMNSPDFEFSNDAFFKKNDALKLSIKQDPLKLNLLMNPAAGIHLITDILPTKYVELFNHSTSEVLSRLDIHFMAAPFIAEKTNPGIPIPSGINGNWKFIHKSNVNTWQNNQSIEEGKNKQLQSFSKQQLYEGWLKLSHLKERNNL